MAILEPRKRTIGVRVSQDEYETLERFCAAGGARSISDLARTAILKFVTQAERKKSTPSRSASNAPLEMLGLKLEQLLAELNTVKGTRRRRTSVATGKSDRWVGSGSSENIPSR